MEIITDYEPLDDWNDGDDDYPDDWDGVEWYCNHDVPNGCSDCAFVRREAEMLDAMSERERSDYLYDGGTFDTYYAPGGPAWVKEQEDRRVGF